MTESGSTPRRRVLIVHDDQGIREALSMALETEAYETTTARSPHEALRLVRESTFDLVISGVFASRPTGALDSIRALREHAYPTPVGVVTSWPIAPEEAGRAGFAFLLSMPFDLDDLISYVAMAINTPLTTEQHMQAQTIHAYFSRLTARDWEGLVALCTEDVVYVLPGSSPFAGVIEGRAHFQDYSARTFSHFPGTEFHDVHAYATPNGLASRYRGTWSQPDGTIASMTGAVIFHFRGRLIRRIGVYLDESHLRALIGA